MKNLWNDEEAATYEGELGQRVYSSRLLGRQHELVLHGGGNTSVKIGEENLLGNTEELLYVKGSGWDLETIEAGGFAPVRMAHLLELAKLERLSDPEMVNELRTHMTLASAPTPSVETILHATLPYRYVDHTHADAVVTITNTENGEDRIREVYGDSVVIVPYVMPGFDLARVCADVFERESNDSTIGMVLMNHGIFSFGSSAKESYDRMIELVSMAESYLQQQDAWEIARDETIAEESVSLENIAEFRAAVSRTAGAPMIVRITTDSQSLEFSRRDDVDKVSQRGPATPDHVIQTKQVPCIGTDIEGFVERYRSYFDANNGRKGEDLTMLDPAPRVALDPRFGLATIGKNVKSANIVRDLYRHTMDIITRGERLGGFKALPAEDIFDVEYWDLEQAKLRRGGAAPQYQGEVVLITGAASGIGKACVNAFLAAGAAVVGLDKDEAVAGVSTRAEYLGLSCDITDENAVSGALAHGVKRFGGVDMLVLNAGVFPGGCRIDSLQDDDWRTVMSVNLDANLALMRQVYPLLKRAPNNGRVVVIGSKNVPAPGLGAAAYSASKAAMNQLMRVAALEWAEDGIRVNSLHPDAVFDTGLWSDDVLESRAAHYGMSVDAYKTRNLLKTEVGSRDVADLAVAMCGPLFNKTTAAQLPVDGGNERVV